jgi:argininosuccinate lyase
LSPKLWSGRVGRELAPEVAEFLRAPDRELLGHDCAASKQHARRLHEAGLLSEGELAEIGAALDRVAAEGGVTDADEDVHSAIERLLGPLGRKLHAGRSRNDQVVAAMRLYVEDACGEATTGIRTLATVLLDRAQAEAQTPMPGYTHMQRAQPVTVGHHLLAWVEMLERDLDRFAAAQAQAARSPLGSGALAGSTLPLPAPPNQVRNSLDAVADRDFALDYLYAVAACFSHLSRMAMDVCLWASAEFGFLRLPEEAATGSSMMPQKLNPDVAELVRGKAGTALGRLTGLLAVLKGLPLAYNGDLQEDKQAVFGARHDLRGALAALTLLLAEAEVDRERMAQAASDPVLLATDEAERLVVGGMAFRDAHERVAADVREGRFEASTSAAESVAARPAPGPANVQTAVEAARARLGRLATLREAHVVEPHRARAVRDQELDANGAGGRRPARGYPQLPPA